MGKDWFESWFDTSYYHILYGDRNDEEAQFFMDNLIDYLQPNSGSKILDMPCGKGRHSKYLASFGFDVLGVDLSENSIKEASEFTSENLYFQVHDMRKPIPGSQFHYIFNLFTSFGYFDSREDNINVLHSAYMNLVRGGIIVIDFMNSFKVAGNLNPKEEIEKQGIRFNIERSLRKGKIVKSIEFKANDQWLNFEEQVQAFTLKDFKSMFKETGFELIDHFGDYELNYYHANTSDRLILIARAV